MEEKSTYQIKSVIEETKQLQRLRQRQRGVDVEDISQIGTSFAAETNRRDEDADMLKYVEAELAKRKGLTTQETESKKRRSADDFLYELPEHIAAISCKKKKSEDMLSNQMLSGIPEVELGIEMKIRNIEATEEAKQKIMHDRRQKKDSGISFVPTNMAANFVQHNRFKIEDHGPRHKNQPEIPKPAPLRVGDADILNKASCGSSLEKREKTRGNDEKATDDFHFEKFKKNMRRF